MKKALITGASRGIGRAVAERLKNEYELFLVCRSGDMSDILKGAQNPVHLYNGDIGSFDFTREVFTDIRALDLLINNAGIARYGLLQDIPPEEWEDIVRTNLTSVYNTCHLAIPLMVKAHSGRIINISSIWGNNGASCEAAYSATKGGINALTKALAKELAPSGIAVNAIAPGVIDTDMNKHLSDEELRDLTEDIPVGRMGSPEEVAEAVLRLSQMPAYLTGQIISIDGGYE